MIQKATLQFLKEIQVNNNRPWFEENKHRYLAAKENLEAFTEAVKAALMQDDIIEKTKLYRIYRDTRFSKDKTPYKGHMGGFFRRAGAERRGGYYFSVQPANETFIGGGFYSPSKEDLFRIRKEFEADGDSVRAIINDPKFVATYGELLGNGVKTAPKGFDKEHPNIDLIRKKQFYALRKFSDKEVLAKDFVDQAVDTYRTIRPFFNYLSDVLTTNLNGESIL
jgi:uncharacterized protein (TIGR02453 family)